LLDAVQSRHAFLPAEHLINELASGHQGTEIDLPMRPKR
jgi:hypothetical protein